MSLTPACFPQDIGLGEFLINYGGALDTGFLEGREQWWGECTPGNFFEHFDHQWSITDFGVSVMFDPGSDLPSRKVVGLCAGKFDIPIEQYPKVSSHHTTEHGYPCKTHLLFRRCSDLRFGSPLILDSPIVLLNTTFTRSVNC